MPVHALINDPDQVGWRGNTIQWAKRAKKIINDEQQPLRFADLQKIAACIRDVRLLRPDLAIHCPPHVPNTWDAMYADVCHVVVTTKTPSMSMINWLGALAYYVRHHPQMGVKRAHQILSPGWDALSMALTDEAWGVGRGGGMVVCLKTDCLRTRTILVLLSATMTLTDRDDHPCRVLQCAVEWLCDRPKPHFCDRLLDLFSDTYVVDALGPKRHRPLSSCPMMMLLEPTHHDQNDVNHDNDILGHNSLRFFHDSD